MHCEVSRKDLVKALRVVGKTIGKLHPVPSISGVKITVADGRLTLKTTNMQQSTTTIVPATIHNTGEYLVSFKLFKKIVDRAKSTTVALCGMYHTLPLEPVTDEMPSSAYVPDDNGNYHKPEELIAWHAKWGPVIAAWKEEVTKLTQEGMLTITTDGSTTIPPMRLEDFPASMASRDNIDVCTIIGKVLKEAVKRVASIAHKEKDTTRLTLTGINLSIDSIRGSIVLVATNGYRLEKLLVPVDHLTDDTDLSVTVPAAAWSKLAASIGAKEVVTLGYDQELQSFSMTTGDTTSSITAIPDDFPDYNRVIPSDDSDYKIKVNRSAFLASLERGSIVANEESNAITLQARGDGRLLVSSYSREKGEYQEPIALLGGFPGQLGISFRGDYLEGFCKQHKGAQEIELVLQSAEQAAIIRAPGDRDDTTVIMPVRLSDNAMNEQWHAVAIPA